MNKGHWTMKHCDSDSKTIDLTPRKRWRCGQTLDGRVAIARDWHKDKGLADSSETGTLGIYEKISKECNIELISYIRRAWCHKPTLVARLQTLDWRKKIGESGVWCPKSYVWYLRSSVWIANQASILLLIEKFYFKYAVRNNMKIILLDWVAPVAQVDRATDS